MMKIHSLKINHIENPLGYAYKTLTASYVTENDKGKYQESARIIVALDLDFEKIIYDTGKEAEVKGRGTNLPVVLRPRTRYFWKVQVWDDLGDYQESEFAWFETGVMEEGFQGRVIAPQQEASVPPVFYKTFLQEECQREARLYLTCLGVYEAYLNGCRIGEELLTPGVTVYDQYVQYQTYDIGNLLRTGENILEISAGDGWYKGLYGYRQNDEYRKGKEFELLADLYVNGVLQVCTDLSWKVKKNKITFSDMYDGETQDYRLNDSESFSVKPGKLNKQIVKERLGQPIKVMEVIKPVALLRTPKGESVLDMGQNMTGRVSFSCREKAGTKVLLEHGEVLEKECFYNGNYRTAKAQFSYVSDGIEREVSAKLCFFGFRYVRLSGFTNIDLEDFKGEVIYSELEQTGTLTTGNTMLNQLIQNILWSQKGNFLDIPTDCPQRDEKLGWTGDAQIFASTACLNMECYEFFRKYLNDIALEQKETKGLVPQIVPSVGRNERTSAAWGDAAVIIPWTLYEHYGDDSILKEQYESMKQWIAYIDAQNEEHNTNPDLWENGFHYGDWLALDGGYYHMPTGGTTVFYISSAYFYYSTKIVEKTAEVLGNEEEKVIFREKAEKIRQAILKEYFTGSGKLSIDTQTAYIAALVFGIVQETTMVEKIKEQFLLRLRKDGYSLTTGFVGTPFILTGLSMCGRDDLAYRLLLSQDYPGWLYPVTLGATTMWERWDALNSDGSMSDSGMNSLNHYANGAIMEWMYKHMVGISSLTPGFRRVKIEPKIHPDLGWISASLKTAAGEYQVVWKIMKNTRLKLYCKIPFDAAARVKLPHFAGGLMVNGVECGSENEIMLESGSWELEYNLAEQYRPFYQLEDSVKELVRNPQIKEYLYEKVPMLRHTDQADIQHMTLKEMSKLPFFLGIGTRLGLQDEVLREIEAYITRISK